MSLVRLVIAVPAVLALVLAALFVVVVSEPSAIRRTDGSGGGCGWWGDADGPRTMTATIPVHNDSADPITVLGLAARAHRGQGTVDFEIAPGQRKRSSSYGELGSLRGNAHLVTPRDAVLPPQSTSTLFATITVAEDAPYYALDDVTVSYAGRFGVIRSDSLGEHDSFGIGAPGSTGSRCSDAFADGSAPTAR